METGGVAVDNQQKTLQSTKNSLTNIKSSIGESVTEIGYCIENLSIASSEKNDVLSIIEKSSNISEENSKLCEYISSNMEIQVKNLEELTLNSSTQNK